MAENSCLHCRLLLSFLFLLMFLISITLKLNQTWSHVSWLLIFLPLWLFNTISFAIIIYLIVVKKWLGKHTWKTIYYTLSLLSSTLFEIFLCVKFQWRPDLPYWLVFSPLWTFIFLILNTIAKNMYQTCQTNIDKAM